MTPKIVETSFRIYLISLNTLNNTLTNNTYIYLEKEKKHKFYSILKSEVSFFRWFEYYLNFYNITLIYTNTSLYKYLNTHVV